MKNQTMTISEYLLTDWQLLNGYFTGMTMEKWQSDYHGKARHIDHDEPWLTLIAARSIFGNQTRINETNRVEAFNRLLTSSGMKKPPVMDTIDVIQLEKQLPEIKSYRYELRNNFYHYFPDIIKKVKEEKVLPDASFEGPTHVDLYLRGTSGKKTVCFIIEAKFNSDISYDISYNPVRDQIIRNIDSGIDYKFDKESNTEIDDFYFLLLTPKIFRTEKFGGNRKTSIDIFQPQRSRLYCYKMDEYREPKNLQLALPHRKGFNDSDWKRIADQIGWITFEDIYQAALTSGTIEPLENEMIRKFMDDRKMVES